MFKIVFYLTLSLLILTVSCAPTEPDFTPQTKIASLEETDAISDPDFVIPVPSTIFHEDTYFVFYELHKKQLVKNTLLICDDKPHGTHPTPVLACGQIEAIHGDTEELPKDCDCDKEDDPVVVRIQGRYKGAKFDFSHTFKNPCEFKSLTKPITQFVSIGLGMKG